MTTTEISEILGISRRHVYRKLKSYRVPIQNEHAVFGKGLRRLFTEYQKEAVLEEKLREEKKKDTFDSVEEVLEEISKRSALTELESDAREQKKQLAEAKKNLSKQNRKETSIDWLRSMEDEINRGLCESILDAKLLLEYRKLQFAFMSKFLDKYDQASSSNFDARSYFRQQFEGTEANNDEVGEEWEEPEVEKSDNCNEKE